MKIFKADMNITKADDNLAHAIAELACGGTFVVLRNQSLTLEQQFQFCNKIGVCQEYTDQERTKHIACHPNILRVTGEKNEHGEEGLFGHTSALDWHANQASNPDRAPLIWLRAAHGSQGSQTSWINMIDAYDDLSDIWKERLHECTITLGYKNGNYSDSTFFADHHAVDKPFKLVHTNSAGKTGLYFPFLQIFGMPEKSDEEYQEIMKYLTQHVTQEKYQYHHFWQDGDVVISEQWLSIHKRWKFSAMEQRVLHRIAFDYSRVPTLCRT